MIVIINGPLGIGKSTAAWRLLGRFDRAAMVDGDYVAALEPFDHYNQTHLDYVYATFGALVAHHQAHSIENIVLNWVWESAAQLRRVEAAVGMSGLPLHIFRLRCDVDVLAARIRGRSGGGADVAPEIARATELAAILDAAAAEGDMGHVIDTTRLSVDQTVARIWETIAG